jgi:hypothetical protein
MKDIVERLLTENTMHSYYDSPEIQVEAATEITRLRARVEELEYAYSKCLAAVGGVQQDGGPP